MSARRYIGYLAQCGAPCNCYRAAIEEEVGGSGAAIVWFGERISFPTPEEMQFLREELAAQCRRMGMVESREWPGEWERPI